MSPRSSDSCRSRIERAPTTSALLSMPPSRRAWPPARMAASRKSVSLKHRHDRGGVGRLLVASLHQGDCGPAAHAARVLRGVAQSRRPARRPASAWRRLPPCSASCGRKAKPYRLVTARAGEYAAEWTVVDLPSFRRSIIRAMPTGLRMRLVMRLARTMIRRTYRGSRGVVRWRRDRGAVDIRGSIFCEVRDPVEQPLCEYYAAAIRRAMGLFEVDVDVETEQCRATGAGQCLMVVFVRAAGGLTR